MQKIKFKTGNSDILLVCKNPKKILEFTKKLNAKVNEIKNCNNSLSYSDGLFITSLHFMNEVKILNINIQNLKLIFYNQFKNEKKTLINECKIIAYEINNLSHLLKRK